MAIPQDTQPVDKTLPYLKEEHFVLDDEGKSTTERKAALAELHTYLHYYQNAFLGYQVNQGIEALQTELAPFLGVHTNNIGDPFVDTKLATHTKVLERAVLDYYAHLWGLDPHDVNHPTKPKTAWGYVLSMGSSEGNIYGLLNARDYLSGKHLMTSTASGTVKTILRQAAYADIAKDKVNQSLEPVIFFSADTHYSVAKAAHTLAIPTFGEMGKRRKYKCPGKSDATDWPTEVPSNPDGSIDVEALSTYVKCFVKEGHPVLIVLNLGSTYRGAHDDVRMVIDKLGKLLTTRYLQVDGNREKRNNYWIHIDGALGATYLPFVKRARQAGLLKSGSSATPDFDFHLEKVSSIVTSGHKYPGAPWACGIYMTRSELQLRPPKAADYVASPDTTFGGSRNGFSAIVLWNYIAQNSHKVQTETIARCMHVAESAAAKLDEVVRAHEQEGHVDLVTRTESSLSIVFPKPHDDIVKEFSLANVTVAGPNGIGTVQKSHLFVMPHVNDALIDRLIKTIKKHAKPFPKTWSVSLPASPDAAEAMTAPTDVETVLHMSMDRGFS